jgi:TRAP-type C4-dicarboxylate transport system substrate-binding protein
MHRRNFLSAACAVASSSALGITSTASAGPATTIRVATLAPKGSSWMRVYNAWNNSLQKKTGGRLKLQFFAGGAAGDERDFVRKMRAGQVDAAAVTSVGLGQIVRSSLVLQAPGVCYTYRRIDAVRGKLAGEFKAQFDKAGFSLLGWNDAGQTRLFSNRPINTPADMRKTRMWAWRDDPTWQSVLKAAQVNGVALGLNEVYPALRTNRIDAFPGTAIAAVAFQWYTKAKFVTREPRGIVIGATVIKKSKLDSLPGDLKKALIETSVTAHKAISKVIRADDQKAFNAIVKRGVKPVSVAAHTKAWDSMLKKARHSLSGKLYPAGLLKRVEQVAASAG